MKGRAVYRPVLFYVAAAWELERLTSGRDDDVMMKDLEACILFMICVSHAELIMGSGTRRRFMCACTIRFGRPTHGYCVGKVPADGSKHAIVIEAREADGTDIEQLLVYIKTRY